MQKESRLIEANFYRNLPMQPSRRQLLVGSAACLSWLAFESAAAAAAKHVFYATPLDDTARHLGFALTDTQGRLRRNTDFSGQVLVLFFGFLSCPSICPATMLELSAAQQAMGAQSDRVTIAFATLDPERDKSAVMEQWLGNFGVRHLGLRDTDDATRRAAQGLKLEYRRIPGSTPYNYTIDHGVQAYVFGPQGHLRLLLRPGPQPHEIAADWRRLLNGA